MTSSPSPSEPRAGEPRDEARPADLPETPPTASPQESPPSATPSFLLRLFAGVPLWLLISIAVLFLVSVGLAQDRIRQAERDLARRVQDTEIREAQREPVLKQLTDALRDSQGKLALLEAKLADSQSQQTQLRAMYDEIARTRGDLLLADVENSIMIAAQQLQLGGNVQSALLALTDAEQLLARNNPSAPIGLQRVIAVDIERLKAVPLSDYAAAVTRLDAVLSLVDQLPLLSDVRKPEPASEPVSSAAPADPPAAGLRGLPGRMARTGQAGWEALVGELRALVRVQRVDEPDALLLTADQRFAARESLRVQLLNARLNLLARNDALFRADLTRAIRSIEAWFDPQSRSVTSALASLRQLQNARLTVELPSLADSVRAVRAARAASESR